MDQSIRGFLVTGANWAGGIIANGLDSTAHFSSLNITAEATVTLDGARMLGVSVSTKSPVNALRIDSATPNVKTISVKSVERCHWRSREGMDLRTDSC